MGLRQIRLSAVCVAFLTLAGTAGAAVVTWDGDTDTDFANGANWVGDSPPANVTANTGDTATFVDPSLVTYQPSLLANRNLFSLDLQMAGWTLGGAGYSLSMGTGTTADRHIKSAGSGTNTIDANIATVNTVRMDVAAGNTLVLNGSTSGSSQYYKYGSGTLILNGASVAGQFNHSGGLVVLGNDLGMGTTSRFYNWAADTLAASGDRMLPLPVYISAGPLTLGDATGTYTGNLTINGNITGSAGITKDSSNTVVLNRKTTVNTIMTAGTLRFAGGDLSLNPGGSAIVNGGTLDLYGGAHALGYGFAGTGGTVTNTAAQQARLVAYVTAGTTGGVTYSGILTGNLAFSMYTSAAQIMNGGESSYTGPTTFSTPAGSVTLTNEARLSGTSALYLPIGKLSLVNSGTMALADRLNDAAPVYLRGGTIALGGRNAEAVTETIGAVNLDSGLNKIAVTIGTGGTTDLTLSSLNRSAGGGVLAISRVTGSKVLVGSGAPVPVNGMVPGYIVESPETESSGSAYHMTYDAVNGFVRATYEKTTLVGASTIEKVNITAAGQTVDSDQEVYALRTTQDIGGTATLALGSGSLILDASAARTISPNLKFGSTGTAEALIYTPVAGSTPIDTLSGTIQTTGGLTKWGSGTLLLMQGSTGNWSGRTTVDAGVLTFDAVAQTYVPGDLFIGGSHSGTSGSVVLTAADQIASTSNVTLTGSGLLNLAGFDQTLAGLTISRDGGNRPEVRISTATGGGTLTLTGDVTASNLFNGYQFYGPLISSTNTSPSAGVLNLNGPRAFNVDGFDPTTIALEISAVVADSSGGSHGLTKTGDGLMYLSYVNNTFTAPITVNFGELRGLGSDTAGESPFGTAANSVTLQGQGRLRLSGQGTSADVTTNVGDVTFSGMNTVTVVRGASAKKARLQLATVARSGKGTLTVQDGANPAEEYIQVASGGPVNDGAVAMVDAYYTYQAYGHPLDQPLTFARYDTANNTFRGVAYSAKRDLNTAVATDIFDSYDAQVLTADRSVYALRTAVYDVSGSYTLTIAGHSADKNAGLIFNGDNTISSDLRFGSAGDAEAIVYVNRDRVATISGGITTTGGLTKSGLGTLILAADNTTGTLDGLLTVLAGTVKPTADGALGLGDVDVAAGAALDLSAGGLSDAIQNTAVLKLYELDGVKAVVAFGSSTYLETVGELWVDGAQKGPGTYGAAELPGYVTGGGALLIVPEPATIALLALGFAGLAALRRRRAA